MPNFAQACLSQTNERIPPKAEVNIPAEGEQAVCAGHRARVNMLTAINVQVYFALLNVLFNRKLLRYKNF